MALDMLVPRKIDVGAFDPSGTSGRDLDGPEYKYAQAMEYLRGSAPGINKTDNNLKSAKESLVDQGVSATTVDMYVEKQLKWSEARSKWEAARVDAMGEFSSTPIVHSNTGKTRESPGQESKVPQPSMPIKRTRRL
jgi:hypothetical protein